MNDWKTILNELKKAKKALENALNASDSDDHNINEMLGYTTPFCTMLYQHIEQIEEWENAVTEMENEMLVNQLEESEVK